MNKVIKLSVMAGACALCVLFTASNVRADELLDLCESDLSASYNSSSLYETYDDILVDEGFSYYDDILSEGYLYDELSVALGMTYEESKEYFEKEVEKITTEKRI